MQKAEGLYRSRFSECSLRNLGCLKPFRESKRPNHAPSKRCSQSPMDWNVTECKDHWFDFRLLIVTNLWESLPLVEYWYQKTVSLVICKAFKVLFPFLTQCLHKAVFSSYTWTKTTHEIQNIAECSCLLLRQLCTKLTNIKVIFFSRNLFNLENTFSFDKKIFIIACNVHLLFFIFF